MEGGARDRSTPRWMERSGESDGGTGGVVGLISRCLGDRCLGDGF